MANFRQRSKECRRDIERMSDVDHRDSMAHCNLRRVHFQKRAGLPFLELRGFFGLRKYKDPELPTTAGEVNKAFVPDGCAMA